MTVLLVLEHDGQNLRPGWAALIRAARALGGEIEVLLAAPDVPALSDAARALPGARRVWRCRDADLARLRPETLALAATRAIELAQPDHALFLAGVLGRATMGRVAALLGAPAASDVVAIPAPDRLRRYRHAGAVLSEVRLPPTDGPRLWGIRHAAFAGPLEPADRDGAPAPLEDFSVDLSSVRSFTPLSWSAGGDGDRPDLITARRVVAIGQGVIDEAGVEAARRYADAIGAALGGTRALVDAHLLPNECQIGQTGKIVAPALYLAFGVSGALQHTAGMKDAGVVVVINDDPEAPFLSMCDYAWIGDAREALARLTALAAQS